jgi:hypothetical protein
VARFSLRWEAEFARGYLEDAGIPSRLQDDGSVGTGPYTGDLMGATLMVASSDAVRARETLESAGVLESAEALENRPPPLLDRSLPPVLRADAQDVTEALRLVRRAETRHGIGALLGFTPMALIPMVGLVAQGSEALIGTLCVLVCVTEGWKWIRAGKEARRLEMVLLELEDEADDGVA